MTKPITDETVDELTVVQALLVKNYLNKVINGDQMSVADVDFRFAEFVEHVKKLGQQYVDVMYLTDAFTKAYLFVHSPKGLITDNPFERERLENVKSALKNLGLEHLLDEPEYSSEETEKALSIYYGL